METRSSKRAARCNGKPGSTVSGAPKPPILPSPLKPPVGAGATLGSLPSLTTRADESSCCCGHAECRTVRNARWCQRWYFVQWVTPYVIAPSDVDKVVQTAVGWRGHRRLIWQSERKWGRETSVFTRVLIRLGGGPLGIDAVEASKLGSPPGPGGCPSVGVHPDSTSAVLALKCCRQLLLDRVRTLLPAMLGSHPGSRLAGDENLVKDLEAELRNDWVLQGMEPLLEKGSVNRGTVVA